MTMGNSTIISVPLTILEQYMYLWVVGLKAHSHQARLRPSTRVDGRRHDVDTRLCRYGTHVKKCARSHQARLRPSTDVNALKIEPCSILSAFTSVDGPAVDGRKHRVDHPMASDVVARDKVMNIQFIKLWRTKLLWRPFGGEILFMMWRVACMNYRNNDKKRTSLLNGGSH